MTRFPVCPASLTRQQIRKYWEEGYLAFEGALSQEEVEAARTELAQIVRRHAFNDELSEYHPGTSKGTNQGGSYFKSRHTELRIQLETGTEPDPDDLDALELSVRKLMWFEKESQLLSELCTIHPRTFKVLEGILGDNFELYQSMALIKPPFIGSEKPWHQDNAYFSLEDMDGVVGTWIALDDVTVDNGCMHVLPGQHNRGPLRHHHTFDCEILPDRLDPSNAVPVELKAGGMMIFHSNLPHQTPPNSSPLRRRALQYHYRRSANPIISSEKFDSIFKESDGTPASCSAARRLGF